MMRLFFAKASGRHGAQPGMLRPLLSCLCLRRGKTAVRLAGKLIPAEAGSKKGAQHDSLKPVSLSYLSLEENTAI
jgi:hypothetical protein